MNLAKSAMLVSVTIVNGGLLGERRNQEASALVQNTYQVSDNRAKATTYLIDRNHKAPKRVVASSQRVREIVYRYTMPWGDDKLRLLPVANESEFRRKLNLAIQELDEARADYALAYPALVSASERELGPLFDASEYPSVDKIKSLFVTRIVYWPIPESGHFVAEISKEAAKEAKAAIETEIEERLIEATYDMVTRAKKVVKAFVDKLEKVEVKIEENKYGNAEYSLSGMIRDSLIDNIDETSYLIERMNITESAQIKKVVKDLRRLSKYSANFWREYPNRYHDQKPEALNTAREIMVNLEMLDLRDKEIEDMVTDAGEYM